MQNHAQLPTPGECPSTGDRCSGVGQVLRWPARTHRSRPASPRGFRHGPHRPQRVREDDDDSHPLDASCSGRWPGDRVWSRCRGRAGGRQGSNRCHRQFSAVDKFLTGRGNLALMAGLHHLRRAVALERTATNLERFELTQAADRPVITYSGGMRRRLDLAMTLMGEPRIVFLDEPTTGLDPRGRQVLWRIVRDLVAGGVTVLLTTQYLEEADRLADRVVLIDRGALVAEGTPSELKTRAPGGRILLYFAGDDALAAPARTARPMIVPGRWRPALQAASGLRNVMSRKNGVDTHS